MKRILLFTMMCLFGLFSLNAQSSVVDLSKQYRVKLVSNTNSSVGVGQYLTIESYTSHADGPAGGVALKDYAESNAQIFALEDAGSGTYYFKSADGYYIYCQSWNVDAYSTAYDMTALGMTDLGDGTFNLMNGTKHFKVEYVNNSGFNGNYPFCDASTASTTWTLEEVINDDLEPAVPANLVATAESYESISLTWDEAENAVKYNVYQGTDLFAEGVTGTSYTATGLNPETEYCFTVTGVRGAKESAASTEACATTEVFDGCYVIFTLNDGYTYSGSNYGWSSNYLTVSYDGVSEQLGLSGGLATKDYTLAIPTGTHVTINFVKGGYYPNYASFVVKYSNGIEICNAPQNSLSSGFAYEFDVDCSPKVTEAPVVEAEATGESTILLKWDAVPGAETYKVYQGDVLVAQDIAETSYTVTGLSAETEYCFAVTTFNEAGESEKSETICANTYKAGTQIVLIGEGTLQNYYTPISNYGNYARYSLSQQIYLKDEINSEPCAITGISFHNKAGAPNTRQIVVYMTNTNKSSYASGSDWVEVSESDIVYQGEHTFGAADEWTTIEFSTPFIYRGKNVIITVNDKTGLTKGYSGYDSFYATAVTDVRAIYSTSSTSQFDCSGITSVSGIVVEDYYSGPNVNNIKIKTEPAEVEQMPLPETPANFVVETIDFSSIALTWDAAANAESYNVYLADSLIASNLKTTAYTVTGLEDETAYCFTVKAVNLEGESGATTESCATTTAFDGYYVELVLNDTYGDGWNGNKLEISYSGKTEVYTLDNGTTITYTIPVPKCTHITLKYNPAGGYQNENSLVVRYQGGDEIWNLSGLSNSTVYTHEFDVICNTVPAAPEVTAEALSATEIFITWDAVDGATSYNIYFNDEVFTTTETEYTVENLTANTNYVITVTAVNEFGESEHSLQLEVLTLEETPSIAAPQNLVATVNGQNSITLTWDAVDGAEDYYVYKDGTMWANTSGATTYTENNLAAGTEYCFAVQADGAAGESELSAEVCATTESVQLAENEIIIGTATTKYYSPFLTILGGGSWFEAIYKSEEIGKACTISELAFSYKDGNETSADINIYLAETTKDEYANPADVTAESALTLVYSGTAVTLCDEEWETFVLNAPFNYSGENNLVVVVTTANTGLANNWNCYSDANSVLIKDVALDSRKPVLKLTLGEGGEGGDEPAEITHRLVGIYQNEWNNVAYTYESETSNVVTEVVEGSYKTVLEYNEDGQIVETTYAWVDSSTGEMDLSQYTLVTYTYEDGVLVSYKEEVVNPWNPSSTEYTFTYEEDFVVKEWPNAKETYAFEDGRLVEKTKYYYDQWAETPDFIKENMVKYEYDENGNCVTETQYNTYGEEPTPQNGVEYYYDMTIAAENVATFAYPHEFLPTHANLVTKALLYYYQEDWQTGEVSKSNFEVKTYNYSPEVAAAPFAPMELKANVVSDVEISLTWVSIETAESFNVYCNGELAGNATETYFTVTGLTAGTEYCFTVKGVNSGVESEASNEACATTMQLVNVVPNAIAFGDVKMGEFWTETSTGVEVKIDLLGKTITSIATDNDFFRVPATINLTEEPVTFKVDYKKSAEAGEYTGNLVVTLSTEETVTIPLSATAYNPVTPDVFELAQEIEFVEGAYTDAPDFATLHDDYNLPNEAEGNNPDAVYTFTLDTESVVNVEVTGENAVYATYKAFGEEEGPTAANAFFGDETVLSTSFSYDFESADLSDFTIVDNDEFKDYTWTVENGSLVSYSFVPTPDYSYPYYIANDADERIITNKAYAITANSVLTLDINVNGSGGNFNWGEAVFIEVTQDGETFTQVGVAYDEDATYSYDFMSKRINLGAKFAELGLEYGEYQIVLHHDQSSYGHISVDNFALTERVNVYTAGTYYLVAAAPAAFEVNVEVAAQEMPVAPKAYRLVSAENHEKTTFVYDETDVNRVVKIESGATVDVLEYNTDGTLAGYKTIATYEDPELGNVEQEMGAVSYVYENGRIVSYSETVQSPMGGTFDVESVITYNAEGQVESVENAAYESVTNYVYNAEGLLSEKVTAYVYGDEVSYDSKEVYTYENGKLVKLEYMYYDWESEEGEWYVVEEYAYTYDANGNCTLVSAYQFNEDFETGEVTKSLYNTTEYYYNTEVLAEEVYTFEYPHFALLDPAKPAFVNVITKDMSYYSYFNEEVGEVVNHTYVLTVYNYDPEILSAPYAPFNLTAEATGESTVALTWEAYADAETFAVYNGTEKVAEGIEGFEYTVEGLKAATEYCFTVKAVNAAGESVASNEACATTEEAAVTVPAVPANLVAEAVSTSSIELTWDAVATATSYNVYQGDNKVATVEEATYTVEGLEYNTEYCFTVTAVNEAGESEKSAQVCEKTLGEGIEELSVSVNIYPNPVENVLFIETEAFVEAISIYTVTGTLIYKEVDFNSNTIDVSEFNGGVYIMKIRTENGETVQRFVKK